MVGGDSGAVREVGRPEGMVVRQIDVAGARAFSASVSAELDALVDAGMLPSAAARFERLYVGETQIRLYDWYGAQFFGAFDHDERQISLHVLKLNSSPRKNAWGRYVNHYLAFTRPRWRGLGYATAAEIDLQAMAAAEGYDRLKTLCQSWLGVLYHERLRDQVWGVNEKGELVIDSPLHPGPWPAGVPIKARKFNTTGRELTRMELAAILTDPSGIFRRSLGQVNEVLDKREWRRAEDSNLGGVAAYPVSDRVPSTGLGQPPIGGEV